MGFPFPNDMLYPPVSHLVEYDILKSILYTNSSVNDFQMRTIMELDFQLEDLDEAEQMLVQVSS